MKDRQDKKTLLIKVLMLLGFHSFLFHLGLLNPVVIFTSLVLLTFLFIKLRYKKDYLTLLFPLASGLLCFLNRFFYWDSRDFDLRNNILLSVSLIFSLALVIRKFRLIKKFLLFFNRLPLKKRLILIFIWAEILFIIASFILTHKGVALGGDEPHYLVISHSISRDGDINVFNQYARDEYREFVDVRLQHHARVGKGFKVWYSYGHLPGLPLTLTPFFLFKIPHPFLYFLIRAYLGIFGALLAVIVYLFTLRLWRNTSLSIWVTAVFTITVPVFFYSIHIFAELQATLLILSSLYLIFFSLQSASRAAIRKILTAGFLLGISVFWGLKYAIFIYLFSAGFFVYLVIKKQPKRALLFVLFPLIFQILFFGYLYYAYGNFNPMSIYNGLMTPEQEAVYQKNMEKIPLQKRIETLLGIFFDQRDGLLLYNPFYILAFSGLILAIIKIRRYWPHLLISCAGFAFILFLGYSTVRPGYCPQARYLTPAAWLLMLYSIIYYIESPSRYLKKLFLYLPIFSIFVTIYQVFHPFTLYMGATHINLNRQALMFQQWSNIHLDLSAILPSFIKVPGNFQYVPNLIFLFLFIALIIFLTLNKNKKRGSLSVVHPEQKKPLVMGILFAIIYIVAVLFPRVPTYNPILVAKPGAQSCKIYGKSRYPTRTKERKFPLSGKQTYNFTVSTLKPAPVIALELENREDLGYEILIDNFDKEVKTVKVPADSAKRVYLKNPHYKSFNNSSFYRLHIEVAPSPGQQPELYLQIYPLPKIPSQF